MSDLLKYALIGGAVYFLWPSLTGGSAPAATTTTPAGSTVPPAPIMNAEQLQLQPLVNAVGAQGESLLLTAAKVPASQLYTTSQWHWFLHIIMPDAPLPNIDAYLQNGDPAALHTVHEYWTALAQYANGVLPIYSHTGTSGLGAMRRAARQASAQPAGTGPRFDMSSMAW